MPSIRKMLPRKKEKLGIPVRKIHVSHLSEKRVLQSSFWMDLLKKEYDVHAPMNQYELAHRFAKGKNKSISFEGFWFVGNKKRNALKNVNFFNVQHNVIKYRDGGMRNIMFDCLHDGMSLDRAQSRSKGNRYDYIIWRHEKREEIWSRFTVMHALEAHYTETTRKYLPRLVVHIIQGYVGDLVWPASQIKEKKKNKKTSRLEGLIGAKRAKEINILLRFFHIRSEEDIQSVVNMIWRLEEGPRLLGQLSSLAKLVPTDEEINAVMNAPPSKSISMAETFIRLCSPINGIHERLETWIFQTEQFQEDLGMVVSQTRTLEHAAREINENESFKMFLGLVLKMINFLGRRGTYTYGINIFTLKNLPKKFLEFAVMEATEKNPKALEWLDDFAVVQRSTGIDVNDLLGLLRPVKHKIRSLQRNMGGYQRQNPNDLYLESFETWTTQANRQMSAAADLLEDVQMSLAKLGIAFGNPNAFCNTARYSPDGLYCIAHFREEVLKVRTGLIKMKEEQQKKLKHFQWRLKFNAEIKKNRAERKRLLEEQGYVPKPTGKNYFKVSLRKPGGRKEETYVRSYAEFLRKDLKNKVKNKRIYEVLQRADCVE